MKYIWMSVLFHYGFSVLFVLEPTGAPLMVFSQPTLEMGEMGPLPDEPCLRRPRGSVAGCVTLFFFFLDPKVKEIQ